jgi:hypothetical protein
MIGPGKYDDAATVARAVSGGSVVLLVIGGEHGEGFSVQAELPVLMQLPRLLRVVADAIERDARP